MLATYTWPRYAYRRPPELDAPDEVARRRVVIVGAGPVGLAAAIDLAQAGVPVTLLDDDDTVSIGSRGLCWAKRTLEVLDRLGVGDRIAAKGVQWNVGRSFHGEAEVFRFELQPEPGHERPGMVNLQQYHVEEALVERALALPALDLRFRHRLAAVAVLGEGVELTVETADGTYRLRADWLIAADGAKSPVRRQLGLDMAGQVFKDRFLIADVVVKQPLFADGAAERWFWFDPPFHRGGSALLHREADSVWRLDFQLGWQADPEEEKKPENVLPRIRAMLGPEREFTLEWVSVYTFQCRRMQRFRHGRVLFVGDAAHQVSPFGARGANSGLQDTDNLVWKLRLVLEGRAPEALLDSYDDERIAAADENLVASTRSTDFITPKNQASLDFRNAVLTLAREHGFARQLVNSGRLSVPAHYADSPLNTPDEDEWDAPVAPGSPLPDAPVRALGGEGGQDWLLRHCGGRFQLLVHARTPQDLDRAWLAGLPVEPLVVVEHEGPGPLPPGVAVLLDIERRVQQRLGLSPGAACLLRPDQHLAARWRRPRREAVEAALLRATGMAMAKAMATTGAHPC